MGWADKAHKKHQVEKLVKKVLDNPDFRKAQQSEDLKAFSRIALISVDFMMRKHGYSKKRILEYVEFLKKQLCYMLEDEEYFKLLNMEIERDTGVNVLRELDIEIREDKQSEQTKGERRWIQKPSVSIPD